MSTYLFKCDKCGHEHEIEIKAKDLVEEYKKRKCLWMGCDGNLRRVYTPFYLRIK